MDRLSLWRRYREQLCDCRSVGLSLDISRVPFPDGYFKRMEPDMQAAYAAMKDLEGGEIANPDEQRMVGHYWLRAAHLAPNEQITHAIEHTVADVMAFTAKVHDGEIAPPNARKFTDMVVVGIGGSALGPQLIADALASKRDKLTPHFIDNTDPDGIERVVNALGARLKSTLVIVISKSGNTKETRNGMVELEAYFDKAGLVFGAQAVAVTGEGSQLEQVATAQNWIKQFPMWDWVGGRTSVTSAVGLVPAALQGVDVPSLLDGAAEMDKLTREPNTKTNPAARLALMWHYETQGRGAKDMVILPYKDRLLLMSRYLQQLVMESLGKEYDLGGQVVNQGIAVYGNKGSTDQHAYVQQLREGVNNFFATFVVVLQDRVLPGKGLHIEVEDNGVQSGDYLNGFWQGTREALYEKGRTSITITLDKLDARSIGALIAFYERAVGIYASLVNINAYHQPGVEAGKKAAAAVLDVQLAVCGYMAEHGEPATAEQIADRMERPQDVEMIYHVLSHLAANKRGIAKVRGKFKSK